MTAVTHVATETAITIEVDEHARVHVRPLDTIALVMSAIAETDEIDPTGTLMTTVVGGMMSALKPAVTVLMPRLQRTSGIVVPCLSSSLLLGCGLVS